MDKVCSVSILAASRIAHFAVSNTVLRSISGLQHATSQPIPPHEREKPEELLYPKEVAIHRYLLTLRRRNYSQHAPVSIFVPPPWIGLIRAAIKAKLRLPEPYPLTAPFVQWITR